MSDTSRSQFDTDKENATWERYMAKVDRCDIHGVDKDRIFEDLNRLSPHLFGKQLEIFLTDVTIETDLPLAEEKESLVGRRMERSRATSCVLNNRSDVEAVLAKPKPRLRVMSAV